MDHSLLFKYAEKVKALRALTEEVEELKPKVLAHLQAEQLDKLSTEQGTFSVVETVTYEYPVKIEALKEAYSEARASAQADGSARAKRALTLRFQAP